MGAPRWPPNPPILRTAPAKPWRSSIYASTPLDSRGSEQPSVLGHHAAVLHDADAGARERLRRVVVADAELEPHDRGLPRQPHDLRRVRLQELRAAEHLDDVGRVAQ